jgi:4'-phosphopantetheinyl transferase
MTAIEIAADEVHLWDANLAVDKDEIERNESLLSRGELLYAMRFTDLRAKNQFIVSRAKLRELLGGYAGQSPRELQFGMTREGKPFLASAKECEFNLTHSGDIVLYGVAHSRHVGVDVERIKEIPRAIELAKRYMSAEEHEKIASASPETRDRDFLSLWVRREGSGKAYGVGVWKVLENGGRVDGPNPLFAAITRDYMCRIIDYANGEYVAAVAALGDDWRLTLKGSVQP